MPETEGAGEADLSEIIERAVGLLRRRRWWIGVPAACVAIVAALFTTTLPNRFVSEATLVVVQQQVSARYVNSDGPTVLETVQSLTLEVLSNARLLGIINDTGLYPKERETRSPEALVQKMRSDINIEPINANPNSQRDITSFTVSFTGSDPQLARQVTSRLTSFFIEENSKAGETRATTTTNFLSEQLAASRKRLAEQEQRRRDFQLQNMTSLPQQQGAFETVAELRSELQSRSNRAEQAERQRLSLELTLTDKLSRVQSERSALLTRFTPQHPEVVKKDHEIARVAGILEELRSGIPPISPQSSTLTDDPSLTTILGQIRTNRQESESLVKEEARLRTEIAQHQARINLAPIHEQQLSEISRNYDIYAQEVKDAESKLLQAQQAVSLHERQEGQRFQLVDPPTLPRVPSSPNRLKLSLEGVAGGFGLGFVLAFLMELKDRSMHTEKEVSRSFALPLVMGVPVLLTPGEQRTRRVWKGFEWLAAGCMASAVLAALVFVIRHG